MQIELTELETHSGILKIASLPQFLKEIPKVQLQEDVDKDTFLFHKEIILARDTVQVTPEGSDFENRTFKPVDLKEMSAASQFFRHAPISGCDNPFFEDVIEAKAVEHTTTMAQTPTHLIELGYKIWAITTPSDWILGFIKGTNKADLQITRPGLQIFKVINEDIHEMEKYR